MMKINKALSVLLLLFVIAVYIVIFHYRAQTLDEMHGFKDIASNPSDISKIILLSVFTVLGILAKIIYDEIEKASDDGFQIGRIIQKAVNSRQAWLALVTCPIIIFSFYKTINDVDSRPLLSLMSFQNGFFFKSVFNKKDNNQTAQAGKPEKEKNK